MTLQIGLHNLAKAKFNEFTSGGRLHGSAEITCTRGGEITLFDTPLKARAIADAVNQPVPDLICDVDARLGELTQIGEHEYRYGDYAIHKLNAPIPGTLWGWIDDRRGGGEVEHEGTCFSILGCLDECDEHRDEMAEREVDAERDAAMREMADDDRAHAAMDRARGL